MLIICVDTMADEDEKPMASALEYVETSSMGL